jgi:hypothetical protein
MKMGTLKAIIVKLTKKNQSFKRKRRINTINLFLNRKKVDSNSEDGYFKMDIED